MTFLHPRIPHHLITRDLAAVAMGQKPADLILRKGKLVDVCTARIRENCDLVVYKGYIALVGDASHVLTSDETQVVDVDGKYLCPGLIDSHMHVESSMVDLRSFSSGVLPHGTTTICPDIHELTNVLGMDAMKLFQESGADLPLKVLTAMPVCVPSLPGMEDSGATIGPGDVKQAYDSGLAFLQGEMMNFPGVIHGDESIHKIIGYGLAPGKVLTGHYVGEDLNAGLNAYIASGMTADHETTTAAGAQARAELGMYVQQRYGSAWLDLPNLITAVTQNPGIDTRFYTMVTDDVTSATLAEKGHLDRVLRKAVSLGLNPIIALQMVTINAAQLLEQSRWIGSLTPGRAADILVVDNLTNFFVEQVFCDGVRVAQQGNMLMQVPSFQYPPSAVNTMYLDLLSPSDFNIPVPGTDPVRARVIQLVPGRVHTLSTEIQMPVINGALGADPGNDIAKVGMFYRHKPQGTADKSRGLGLVSGTGFKPGTAYASTVCHDCHNLMVVGMDDDAMGLAANTLINSGGGLVVVQDNRVISLLPLPLGGLMSLLSVESTAAGILSIEKALRQIGCPHEAFEMTMSLMGLVVIGELRLSNRGLVEMKEGQVPGFVNLIIMD
ncbi:MAG: adenine deaminase [Desulfobacteraceae bacterium]|nr:adenine deaminase [Desulfobacteraceae bacterium]